MSNNRQYKGITKVIPSTGLDGEIVNSINPLITTKPQLRKEIDTTDGSVIYTGLAIMSSTTDEAVWQIKRTTISGSSIKDEWADGDINFDNIFDNRGSLTYD